MLLRVGLLASYGARIQPGFRPLASTVPKLLHSSTVRHASSNSQQDRLTIKHIGVPMDMYIQPSPKNVPPFYKNPKLAIKSVYRRFLTFIKNTVFIAQFRIKSKIKPRFVEWRNLALETYIDTNHAFAEKNIELVQDRLSIWVYEALKSRLKSVPANTKLSWKLVKFNSTPKIVSLQPILLPGKPLREIQIIYRIESRQRLAKITPGDKEPQVVEHDVVDYAAFSFDASKIPAKVYFAGTLFESPLDAPMPVLKENPADMMSSMKTKGDIFRLPPKPLAKQPEEK